METHKWSFQKSDLEKVITPKTKMLLVNTPHNPTGAVFNKEEMGIIVEVLRENPQIILVMDEVYENIVYEGEHFRIQNFGGKRTLSPTDPRVRHSHRASPTRRRYLATDHIHKLRE